MSKNSSANKRAQISLRNRLKNKVYKSAIKTLRKKYINSLGNLNDLNYNDALSNLSVVYSKIDKAVKKGVLHKNNGARKKSLLARTMRKALQAR
uniref:ribosomal protein S20 n=1 Tax=Catenella fusiformis TaxID=3024791 RepID=UPI0027DA9036|nr:ribosomal protein S20 [Catenella fusiformis]WCH57525.1 ribosomal protein S20 [Catenella fusiformis]